MPKPNSKQFIFILFSLVQVIDFKSEGHSFKTITNDAVPADNLVAATKELALPSRQIYLIDVLRKLKNKELLAEPGSFAHGTLGLAYWA